MEATGSASVGGTVPDGSRTALLREPLFWGAVAAFSGTVVGLFGTVRQASLGDSFYVNPAAQLLAQIPGFLGEALVMSTSLGAVYLTWNVLRRMGRRCWRFCCWRRPSASRLPSTGARGIGGRATRRSRSRASRSRRTTRSPFFRPSSYCPSPHSPSRPARVGSGACSAASSCSRCPSSTRRPSTSDLHISLRPLTKPDGSWPVTGYRWARRLCCTGVKPASNLRRGGEPARSDAPGGASLRARAGRSSRRRSGRSSRSRRRGGRRSCLSPPPCRANPRGGPGSW